MTAHFVLLPSPLLGAATWEPVAIELRAAGQVATVVATPRSVRSPDDVLDAFLSSLPDESVVLVPHSNAGLFVPVLVARGRVRATIFVDAALPPTDKRTTTTASADFLAFLAQKADASGVLPVWTKWWPQDDVEVLFPDPTTRGRVEEEQLNVPLTYFTRPLAVPQGWNLLPCAYLAFGDAYADETRSARSRRWPVTVMSGSHLEMLRQPAVVAQHIRRLTSEAHDARQRQ